MRKIFMLSAAYALLLGAGSASAACYERFPAGADTADETLVEGFLDFNRDGIPDTPFAAVGPIEIQRGKPTKPAEGRCEIPTEMTGMEMLGSFTDPTGFKRNFTLTTNPRKRVTGLIKQQVAGKDFPADFFFDTFVELVVPINPTIVERAFNVTSARWSATINCIPYREEDDGKGTGRWSLATVKLTSSLSDWPYADLLKITHRPFFVEPVDPQC